MQFARFISDEYYLIWDSDNIPVKPLNVFGERPYFDMKKEYHAPYFETISKILPGIHKAVKGSFISEHMLIKTEYMREMLDKIESNERLKGRDFQEKIINAINIEHLEGSGFSEFETFGNYVMICYPDSYALRKWHSLRSKSFYEDISQIDDEQIKWLSKSFDAITLEKWQNVYPFASLCSIKLLRIFIKPMQLIFMIKIAIKIKRGLHFIISPLRYFMRSGQDMPL